MESFNDVFKAVKEYCSQKIVKQSYDLFIDPIELERERKMQQAMIDIKKKFGKNAILKGTNLQEGATTVERNQLIGGHKA